jgi:predicted phosphodiesterase
MGIHEGFVDVNGAKFMLWHGEDGGSYATSYRVQKIIEAFSGGEKPSVLMCGHTHKQCYIFDRNIHALSLGSIQKQSGFMRYKRLPAHVGFWIIKGCIDKGEVKWMEPRFYPFYQ